MLQLRDVEKTFFAGTPNEVRALTVHPRTFAVSPPPMRCPTASAYVVSVFAFRSGRFLCPMT